MHQHPTLKPARPVDRVEVMLRREHWTWSDYIAAGLREFDGLYVDTPNPSPFQPGQRRAYAVKYARVACPEWKRLAALAEAREGY